MNTDPTDSKLAAAQDYERTAVTYSMAPSAAILLEHAELQPGERVADIACGTGIVTRQAAPMVGASGAIAAVDINAAMLAIGRALPPPEGATIDWREGDALALPLADAAFDVVLCQHGLPFFPDGVAALREMHRILTPTGRACLALWDIERSPVSYLIWSTISRRLETPILTLARGFALGDVRKVRAMLDEAGFQRVMAFARNLIIRQPKEDNLIGRSLASVRGIVPWLAEMTADKVAALAQAVEEEAGGALSNYVEDGRQLFPMGLNIVIARK